MGTFALLNKESLLAEPSGCAGIGGLIKFLKNACFDGAEGILFVAVIYKNTLNRILEQKFYQPHICKNFRFKAIGLHTPTIKSFTKIRNELTPPSDVIHSHPVGFKTIGNNYKRDVRLFSCDYIAVRCNGSLPILY